MKPLHYVAIGCVLASLLVCAFLLGRVTAPAEPVSTITRDTVIVHHTDTIVREKPVYYARRVIDTLYLPAGDTAQSQDTPTVAVEREQRAYRDTSFEAWVSGVEPTLDSIRIFAPVQCVTVTERVPVKVRSRWGLGVSAGYGITLTKEPQLTPYVGVGISYNIISW